VEDGREAKEAGLVGHVVLNCACECGKSVSQMPRNDTSPLSNQANQHVISKQKKGPPTCPNTTTTTIREGTGQSGNLTCNLTCSSILCHYTARRARLDHKREKN
jgi:hypothetical protein